MREMPLRRLVTVAVLAVLAVSIAAGTAVAVLSGVFTPKVRVQTGTVVKCTYGHIVSDNVHWIRVPADEVKRYRVVTRVVTCDKHRRAEQLYREAQRLIAAGDLEGARKKLEEVLALDPLFGSAALQLSELKKGGTPTADTEGAKPKPAPKAGELDETGNLTKRDDAEGGQTPLGPVASLLKYVPATLTGYKADPPVEDPLSLSRQYRPASRPAVSWLVIVVEQYKDASFARSAIDARVKGPYPSDRETVTIGGRSVYIGTDGRKFAAAAFNDAGIVVIVEIGAVSGSPGALKGELKSIVTAIAR